MVRRRRTFAFRFHYRNTVFSAFLLALVADQVTKHVASLRGIVEINPGISFGFFSGFWLTLALIAFFFSFYQWSCHTWQRSYPLLMGLLLGGALSNIVDRLVLGGVRDFLPLPFLQFLSLPFADIKNNLADWFIVVSLLLIFLGETVRHKRYS